MRLITFILILSVFISFTSVIAQGNNKKFTIQGTVTDSSNNPVVNAFIMIDNINTGTATDSKGNFSIRVNGHALKIAIISFKNGMLEEEISGRTHIDLSYKTSSSQQKKDQKISPGEDVVNTGYSIVKRKNLTYSIDKIDATKKKYAGYISVSDILREFNGVRVSGSNVIIQDSKDFFGPVFALIVADGVYIDNVDILKPADIESIQVLKGAAAAIYGTQAYGGAVVITTKKTQ